MNAEMYLLDKRLGHAVATWVAIASVVLSGCAPAAPPKDSAAATNPAETPTAVQKESVLVSAAASTKDVMEKQIEQFNRESDVELKLNPGPSSGLARQIIEGAPADLFLSASQQWADEVTKAGLASDSLPLLTNSLVIVVARGNPAKITKPEDLQDKAVQKIALAGESVPAGVYADQALKSLKLYDDLTAAGRIVRGQDVRVSLSYVERGEAEAGIVYATDVLVSDKLETAYIFEPTAHDQIVYVLQLLKHGDDNQAVRKFFEFLQSDAAEATFRQFGFERLKK